MKDAIIPLFLFILYWFSVDPPIREILLVWAYLFCLIGFLIGLYSPKFNEDIYNGMVTRRFMLIYLGIGIALLCFIYLQQESGTSSYLQKLPKLPKLETFR